MWYAGAAKRWATGFPIFEPYYKLTAEQKRLLWRGEKGGRKEDTVCIDAFFDMLKRDQYKIQNRVMLARYRGKTTCPVCGGSRLRPGAEYVKVGGMSITRLVQMPITELRRFFDELRLDEHDARVASRLLTEIRSRLNAFPTPYRAEKASASIWPHRSGRPL